MGHSERPDIILASVVLQNAEGEFSHVHSSETHRHSQRLSAEMFRLAEFCKQDGLSFRALFGEMTDRSHMVFTLLLGIPFLLPIPIPGLSIPFGVCIGVAGIRAAMHRGPWIPNRWMDKPAPCHILHRLFSTGAKLMQRLEKVVRPRGRILSNHSGLRSLSAVLVGICGFILALPLPPGTNFPPAASIVFLSLGLLEEDDVFIVVGWIAFVLNILFFGGLFFLGAQGLEALLNRQ